MGVASDADEEVNSWLHKKGSTLAEHFLYYYLFSCSFSL
jgi:hypothetical protein